MKVNLTLDARLITNSGIGVYIQNLISKTWLDNFKVKILHRRSDLTYFKHLPQEVELVEYNPSLYSIGELVKTPGKTLKSDIFWSPHYNVPLINFASKLKVVTIHDVYHLAYFNTLNFKQRIYARLIMQRAVKYSDIIFTVSKFSKGEIVKYTSCNPDKISVVHNGIDFKKYNFTFSKEKENEVLLKYRITGSYILYVGNVKPHKNLKNALLGYKQCKQDRKGNFEDIKFVIAGKQEGFITGDTEVANIIREPFFAANVIFTGWVDEEDLPGLYQRASIFIFPSLYEGFGFPPLEAMAAGCPVVSSDAACLPEIYESAVIYFDPNKVSSIAGALLQVLSNDELRSELIEKGYAQSKKFSWDKAISQKLQIIEQHL